MDLKRYRKTRYENIYQNIKNKNYIITISNPKTTISESVNLYLDTADHTNFLKSPCISPQRNNLLFIIITVFILILHL